VAPASLLTAPAPALQAVLGGHGTDAALPSPLPEVLWVLAALTVVPVMHWVVAVLPRVLVRHGEAAVLLVVLERHAAGVALPPAHVGCARRKSSIDATWPSSTLVR